jgi:hypothetical protein
MVAAMFNYFSAVMAGSRPIHGCLPTLLSSPGMRRGLGEKVDADDDYAALLRMSSERFVTRSSAKKTHTKE